MINIIGAFIVTILLLGIVISGPSLRQIEETLDTGPKWAHFMLLAFLTVIAAHQAFDWFSSIPLVAWPNFLLSGFSLWVHEAGHIYWAWDGQFLHSLGGTLNEVLFPLIPAWRCYRRNYVLLMSVLLYWFGHNCFGISRYMRDAREMALPLLGGVGTHDWNFMLSELGLLKYDDMLANLVWTLGLLVVLLALGIYLRALKTNIVSSSADQS